MPALRRGQGQFFTGVVRHALADIKKMFTACPDGEINVGGSQEWYAERWHRLAGCGPTVAANLIWYAAGPDLGETYLALQQKMFSYVTPGARGVNTSKMFTDGIKNFCTDNGLNFKTNVLEIPQILSKRPEINAANFFIAEALRADSPVAFLNLSNGTLTNLENWHWVTITAYDDGSSAALICDQGEELTIDFREWLATSVLGGALAHLTSCVQPDVA